MGEVAHCRFTRQHASGQLTAGRYPPVSVDVALAAALDRQRWAERTAKSTGNVWATQERAKQTKGRSHPCKRQGYKNAASNKVTRAKERTTFSPISCTDLPFLQTFPFLAGEKPLVTPSVLRFVPEPQNTVVITPNPLLPLTLHDIRLLPGPFFLHYPTASLRSTRPSAFSPLVTILALHHTHRPSSQGPDRTLPYLPHPFQKTTAKQDVVAHCLQRLCLYRLFRRAVAVPR